MERAAARGQREQEAWFHTIIGDGDAKTGHSAPPASKVEKTPATSPALAQCEPHQAGGPGRGAVDGKRCESSGLEIPGEVAHGKVAADERGDAASQDLAVDPSSHRPQQVWDLVDPGGQDDR